MKRILLIFVLLCLFLSKGFCQPLSSYTLCAFDSTYVALPSSLSFLTPDASFGGGGYWDDDTYNSIPIGFNFVYCGTTYTTLSASANCYVTLGQLMPLTGLPWSFDNDLDNLGGPIYGYSGGYFNLPRPILAPLWTDILTSGADVRYNTVGTPGNRVFTIEWVGVSFYPSFTPFESVQIKLYETLNWIDFRYNNFSSGSYSMGYCAIGITGGSGSTGSAGATGAQPFWSLNDASAAPVASMAVNTRNISGQPAANQVYRWMQCGTTVSASNSGAVCATGTVSLTATGTTGATYSWSGPGGYSSTNQNPVITGISTTGAGVYTVIAAIGCCTAAATTVVTVTPTPSTITGTTSVCVGSFTSLSDVSSGGTWSSSATGIATIGATTGVVAGISSGTATITYTVVGGCFVTTTITVNPLPSNIAGTALVCVGGTTSLTDATGGGTWSSGSTGIATIGATTGVVSGIAAGTATISYSLTATGCYKTIIVTVNPLPSAITGTASVCTGSTTTLADATAGGTWSSSNTAVATITGVGVVTGVASGTTTISYTLGTGCYSVINVTVNPTPLAITGTTVLCSGTTTSLSDATGGGTWSSGTTSVATVSSSGVVSGVSAGTTNITYTLGSCYVTRSVTVNGTPVAISGTASVCVGATTPLTDATAGGTWSSSNTAVATISGTGVVSGVSSGTSIISYTMGTGCYTTVVVTVMALPASITGLTAVCVGSTISLSDATSGGAWSSGSVATATVGSATGVVTGVAAGTVTISYGSTCFTTYSVTVNPLPSAITGIASLCLTESNTTLTDATGGGNWSSGSTSLATISGTGVVTGASAGTANITYTLPATGCYVTRIVTVNALPATIAGASTLCVGSTNLLTDVTAGGTWSSSSGAIATISGTGTVTGVASGTVTLSYTIAATGCYTTFTETVNPLPAPITGIFNICATEGTSLLADATGGGTWSSSSTAIATIGATTGVVNGISAGTLTITYSLPSTCYITHAFTVNPLPSPITGSFAVCVGSTTPLTDAAGGGTWSSSNTAVATIGAGTGIITGVSAGTSNITYTSAAGCYVATVETVQPLPTAITAATFGVCQGLTITLTDGSGGGTWSSGSGIATIGSLSGIVTGISPGTVNISYTLGTGCSTSSVVTVYPLPAAISGPTAVCVGSTVNATDISPGGSWSSNNTSIAIIGSGSGLITGISTGSDIITYTLPTGCIMTETITVNPLPTPITGPTQVCVGNTITINDLVGGGTWTSSNTAIATVSAVSGTASVVTGVSAGAADITYTLGTGCYITGGIIVNPLPTAITGPTDICESGGTALLTDATPGGTWSSSNTSVATIGATTGIITGLVPGITNVSYTLTATGCMISEPITVHAMPTAILGSNTVCIGSSISLTGVASGGTWTCSPTTIATIGNTTGILTGVSSGVVTITYSVAFNCFITTDVTVNPLPTPVITPLGDTMMCPGGFVTLLANTGIGLTYQWYVSGAAVPGAVSTSLLVTTAGIYSVMETNSLGCNAYSIGMNISINPPFAAITPPTSDTFCVGAGLALSANTGIGLSYQWMAGGFGISGATNATYIAPSAGTYKVVVTNMAGCSASDSISVYTKPSPVPVVTPSGPLSFCVGDSVTLTGSTGLNYQWVVGGVPIVGATTNSYTTSVSGNYTLLETNAIGCTGSSAIITVIANALPLTIITPSGPTSFCTGGSVTLSVPSTAGCSYQWYSSGYPIAGATNFFYSTSVTGIFTVRVINSLSGCSGLTTVPVVVASIDSPSVIGLTPTSYCWGSSATLAVNVPVGATGILYQWYFEGTAISGATNVTFSSGTPGNYSCVLFIPGSCTIAANPLLLTEFPLPNPIITWVTPNLITQNYFVSYQWYRDLVLIPGATTWGYHVGDTGSYAVKVTDTNGCQSVSDVFVLTAAMDTLGHSIRSGVQQFSNSLSDGVKIYPNPTNTMVYIESTAGFRVVLSSIDGRKLMDDTDVFGMKKELDISKFTNGTYLLMVYDLDGRLVKVEKLIKAGK